MTTHRFYAPDASGIGQTVALPPGEAHHLRHVLRLRRDATVHAFDGRGREFVARVQAADRRGVSIRTVEAVQPVREPAVDLELALAILKGRTTDTVVRDATLLGVRAIQPIITARSHPGSTATSLERAVGRWQAVAVASARQCRRAVVPAVKPPIRFAGLLARERGGLGVMLVEPAVTAPHAGIRTLADQPPPALATIAVGPEGGWTAAEVDAAVAADFRLLTLGSRTLPAAAAPAAALAILQYVWGEL